MLNIFDLNKNPNNINKSPKHNDKSIKAYPVSTREWNNSVYNFNKNNLYSIPSSSNLSLRMIRIYFTLFNLYTEGKLRTKRLMYRFKRLSSNKIYVSNAEFKHTNNKVTIILYVFNRQKNNYLLAIKKWFIKTFNKKEFKIKLIKKLSIINTKGLDAIKSINKERFIVHNLLNNYNFKNKGFNNISIYINNFYIKLMKKSLKKLQLYIYYKQLVYINKSKHSYSLLQFLTNHIESIYNKNVEINLVNINKFYLNSDIISESIKLKVIRNRRRLLKYINTMKNKININNKVNLRYGNTNMILSRNLRLNRFVFSKLKYKHVSGFRLESSGRLTRRNTASRSVSKQVYNGTLLNIDSSYKGLSSLLLKGNLKPNIQLTKLSSKSRIGSFGIKSWVSGN